MLMSPSSTIVLAVFVWQMTIVPQPHSALADSLPSLDQVRYSLARLCGLDRNRHTGSSVADILLSQSDARLTALLAALAQIRALPQRLDSTVRT